MLTEPMSIETKPTFPAEATPFFLPKSTPLPLIKPTPVPIIAPLSLSIICFVIIVNHTWFADSAGPEYSLLPIGAMGSGYSKFAITHSVIASLLEPNLLTNTSLSNAPKQSQRSWQIDCCFLCTAPRIFTSLAQTSLKL